MDREPIGIGRLPASGCQAIISAIIGVDLPMPEKPTLAATRCGLCLEGLHQGGSVAVR
jgi:hypothetical protein